MLQQTFRILLSGYLSNEILQDKYWFEIEKNYASKSRHYHNLQHLENLLEELIPVKENIHSWETILFTLFYHDIIYNTLSSDNEERSAGLAEKRMKEMGLPGELIERCKKQVLATKSHTIDADSDTNYFTDADLSVLGKSWEIYSTYYQNIRKEYAFYPDMIYKPGRKKVLQHFLSMTRIYKTDFFHQLYEQRAKENLTKELALI